MTDLVKRTLGDFTIQDGTNAIRSFFDLPNVDPAYRAGNIQTVRSPAVGLGLGRSEDKRGKKQSANKGNEPGKHEVFTNKGGLVVLGAMIFIIYKFVR